MKNENYKPMPGKNHPCDELHYGHPFMKEVVRTSGKTADKAGDDTENEDDNASREHVTYDYELDDGQEGALFS